MDFIVAAAVLGDVCGGGREASGAKPPHFLWFLVFGREASGAKPLFLIKKKIFFCHPA
jgi:hypothetical protein